MVKQNIGRILLIIALLIPIVLTTDNNTNDINPNNKRIEKLKENSYIQNDASISKELNLYQLTSQIKPRLINVKNQNDLERIKKDYPEIVEIKPLNNYDFRKQNKDYLDLDNLAIDERVSTLILPIDNQLAYEIKVDASRYTNIEEKQELRMYTVTHVQNNRWKTIPTKYRPKKNLSLNIEQSLPDLKPSFEEKGISHYIKNEVLIKFNGNIDEDYLNKISKLYALTIKKKNKTTVIASSDIKSTKELIRILEVNELPSAKIEYIEPHFIYLTNNDNNLPFRPNDILYNEYQWNLPTIYTEQGWEVTRGKEDVIVAVIDTGVDLNHPEFEGKLVDGINIIDPKTPPMDDDGHGTHVAGIISANTNNMEGIAGITWYNKIMPIKVLDQSGAGTLFDVAEGIIWATDNGAKVINMSLGNYAESKYLHDAIKYAYNKDVVLIAATGNDNTDEFGYPAAYPEVIGVSALDTYQRRAEFSNYGAYVDVVAPGVNIPSTYPGNQYAALSGTSMASPHVAGLAGLIRSLNPNLTNKEVYKIIRNSSTDMGAIGKDQYYGYGVINVEKAISIAAPQKKEESILLKWLREILRRLR